MPQKSKASKDKKDQIRNTHSTNAGLEDAIALVWEILDEATRFMLFVTSKAKRLGVILKILRSSPHAYKKNTPYDGRDDEKYKNL
jgi:hypothetical protein